MEAQRVSKEKITGVEFFPGKEGFQPSGKVHVECLLDFTTGRKKGVMTKEYSLDGDSKRACEFAQSIFHLPTPFYAEVGWVDVVTKQGEMRKIVSFKPIQVAPQQQKPAA